MKKLLIAIFLMFSIYSAVTSVLANEDSPENSAEDMFNQYCLACHSEGGNFINPQKTLHKKDLYENNIKTPEDIVNFMRHPGPGMRKFDEETIPNKFAREIAEYILKTFK